MLWRNAGAQTPDDPLAAFRRVADSIPVNAVVRADWRCASAGDSRLNVDTAIGSLRRELERNRPGDPNTEANLAASRAHYEQMRRGGIEVRDRRYAWAPAYLAIEDRLVGADGAHQHNLAIATGGATYDIKQAVGFAEVKPGNRALSGSLAEQVLYCGVRLDDIVEKGSLTAGMEGGQLVLRGRFDFHAGARSLPIASRFEVVADPECGCFPTRLRAWAGDTLRETAQAEPGRFGDAVFPARVQAVRYRGTAPAIEWTITVREAQAGAVQAETVPRAPVALNVFDERTGEYPAAYRLEAGDRFRSLQEARRLSGNRVARRGSFVSPTGLLRTAGLLVLGLTVLPVIRRPRARRRPGG